MNVETAVSFVYESNFWRTLEMSFIDCDINLILTWSANYDICEADRARTFPITDTKLYVLGVTLSTKYNTKIQQQLKSGFKRTSNCNKYQPKVSMQAQNQYLAEWVDPSLQEVNSLFVLSIKKNIRDRTAATG